MVLGSSTFALLLLCSLTFLWCAAELVSAPPFGANTAWIGGAECTGADFQPRPWDICICPRETTCIKDTQSLIFLALARLSAYSDYPLYVLLFVSKAHNLRAAMHRSYLSVFLPLDDLHELHAFAGKIVGLEVMWHSFWHLLRWGLAGDIRLAVQHVTGITGLVSLLLTPLIVWPMLFTRLRKGIDFTVRKWLHYLSIVWGVSICFHAPQRHIAKIMGSAVGLYLLDWLYGFCFKTVRVQTLVFTRIASAVEVAWPNPEGFKNDGSGYVYICLPWISRVEWHAFSLISHPTRPNHSCVCISAVGDWSKALHAAVSRPCSRPGWLYGPFPTPFSTATNYSNLIAVASGIGVAPSISTVVNLRETRRVHLIWMCRDADLLEFYLKNVRFDDDAWSLIYYTGERNLKLEGMLENPMVRISFGRPQLAELIVALVDNTTFGTPMPPELVGEANEAVGELPSPTSLCRASFCNALRGAMATYSPGDMHALAAAFTKRTMGASATAAHSPPGGSRAFAVDPAESAADVSGAVDSTPLSPEGWATGALAAAASSPGGSAHASAVDLAEERGTDASDGAADGKKPVSPEGLAQMVETVCGISEWISGGELVRYFQSCSDGRGGPLSAREVGDLVVGLYEKTAVQAAAGTETPTSREIRLAEPGEQQPPTPSGRTLNSGIDRNCSRRTSITESTTRSRWNYVENWEVMYCGSAAPVIKTLSDIHREYQIPLKIESFAW